MTDRCNDLKRASPLYIMRNVLYNSDIIHADLLSSDYKTTIYYLSHSNLYNSLYLLFCRYAKSTFVVDLLGCMSWDAHIQGTTVTIKYLISIVSR